MAASSATKTQVIKALSRDAPLNLAGARILQITRMTDAEALELALQAMFLDPELSRETGVSIHINPLGAPS